MDDWNVQLFILTATDPLVQMYVDGLGVLVVLTEHHAYSFHSEEELVSWNRRPCSSVRHG